jgi:phage-related protein
MDETEWSVKILQQAKTEIENVPLGLRGKLLALLKLAKEIGLSRIPSRRKKHMRGGIWEFRVNAAEGIARALYTVKDKKIYVLLVFVKKTQKTPLSVIDTAEQRFKEVRNDETYRT